ncbi:MAG: indole-3-glycerol phosphate synthase TrpC [Clostridia bacterium]|nr:indole-3-glycerol phosphate synthase TrpC [Clostridia bacterium]
MILEEIAKKTKERILKEQQMLPSEKVKAQAQEIAVKEFKKDGKFLYPFEKALKTDGISFICEVKKASPSKGVIAADFPYVQIAREYEAAGASALSVLTEPFYFKGSDNYLNEISQEVKIPVLRKDFTVSPYMVYQAKILGASAVLLICAMLSDSLLKECFAAADSMGLSAVFEAHTSEEVLRAVNCGARIIGVNNRNLNTFDVDISTSSRLRQFIPQDIIFISESGIKTAEDINNLKKIGADGVLIGETLMRSSDKKATLDSLRGF